MSLRPKLIKLSQTGDTIVEVLIAVTVLGFVLAGAARIIDTDILTIENHNEHAQAIQLLESQIEDLRIYGGGSGGSTECFTLFSGHVIAQSNTSNPGGGPGHDHCIVQSSGVQALSTTNPAYKINITPPSAANNDVFNVQVTWNNVLGGSQNQASLEYRTQ